MQADAGYLNIVLRGYKLLCHSYVLSLSG